MLKKINFLMTYTKIYVDILHECLNLLYNHFYSVFLLWICWGWVVGALSFFFFFWLGALSWFSVDEFKLHKTCGLRYSHRSWVGDLKRRCMTYSSEYFFWVRSLNFYVTQRTLKLMLITHTWLLSLLTAFRKSLKSS